MKQELLHIFLNFFIFSYFSQYIPHISSSVWFILSKLWCVIAQISHNRPRRRSLSNFFQYLFKQMGYNTFVCLIISCASYAYLATKRTHHEKYEIVIKLLFRTNTALLEFGLRNSDIRQLPWSKVKFRDDFLTIFDITVPFFEALSQDG